MLRPEPMTRALIVGPREKLESTIEGLHAMQLLHVMDHHGEDETFGIGKPLAQASELSDSLVKIRSMMSILAVKAPPKEKAAIAVADLREKIRGLEINILEEDGTRKKIESLLADLGRRIEELRPFATLGLPLELYRDYESISVLVGRIPREPEIAALLPEAEVFRAEGIVAVFVRKEQAEAASDSLGKLGFSQLDIPKDRGDPKALLRQTEADEAKWTSRLLEVQGRLEKFRQRYAGFVVAAEEALEVEVEKAEAPLRFAVSDHSFVIDGWLPTSRFRELSSRLAPTGVHVEASPPPRGHDQEDPPVLLKNPKPARPFEFLIHLYSTPSYRELDPTVFLGIAFPFFFGFMVGDAGYGALFLVIGVIAFWKLPMDSVLRRLLLVVGMGGAWSFVLGLFVFGEAFGIPFHPAFGHEEELSWAMLGIDIPLEAIIHKTFAIADMIYLSILFAAIHLGFGYIFGFVNEAHHNRKHAIAKLGWFACLFGIFTMLTYILRWNEIAAWVWEVPLGWFPRAIEPLGISLFLGVPMPLLSFILILLGALLGLLESVIAPLEVASLLANVMSYTRLAGIGIGKAAIAGALNGQIFTSLLLTGDTLLFIMGILFLFLAQALVFLLGGISAGIQAVRLNYVEAFIKFYKGNGIPFRPFGKRTTQEV